MRLHYAHMHAPQRHACCGADISVLASRGTTRISPYPPKPPTGAPAAAAAAAPPAEAAAPPVSAPPPTAEVPDKEYLPPTPPTAGKRSSGETERMPSAAAAAAEPEPATLGDQGAAASVGSGLDPSAPAFEPAAAAAPQTSSLAEGADQYERGMRRLAGNPTLKKPLSEDDLAGAAAAPAEAQQDEPAAEAAPASCEQQQAAETAAAAVVLTEGSEQPQSLAAGADNYERGMRHLAGNPTLRRPLSDADIASDDAAAATPAEAEAQPGAAAAAEPEQQAEESASAPATGPKAAAEAPVSLAAGADAHEAALQSLINTPEHTLQRLSGASASQAGSALTKPLPMAAEILREPSSAPGLNEGADAADAGVATLRLTGEDSLLPPSKESAQPVLQVRQCFRLHAPWSTSSIAKNPLLCSCYRNVVVHSGEASDEIAHCACQMSAV